MPTYQYACTDCDHRFETVQSFSEDSLTECPECTGRLRKLFNAVGIVFKGSGFYRNDSRSGGSGSGNSGNSGGSTNASSGSGGSDSGSSSSSESSSTSSSGSSESSSSSSSSGSTTTAGATS